MGYNLFAAVGEETTWATPATRNKFAKVMVGSQINHRATRQVSAKLSANVGADPEKVFDAGQQGEATIIVPSSYDDGFFLKVLKHLMGKVVTAGAGPYTQTFTRQVGSTPSGGAVPTAVSLSMELNYELPDAGPLEARLLAGARVKSGKFSWNAGEEITVEANLLGKEQTQVAKTGSPTYPDYDTYEMHFSQAAITINGTAFGAVCSGLEFTIDNGYEPRLRLGSVYTQAPLRKGKGDISGTIRLDWEASPSAKALWQAFKDNVANSVIVTLTSGSYSVVVTLPKCYFTAADLAPEEGQLQPVELPFIAIHDAMNTAVKIVYTTPNATV